MSAILVVGKVAGKTTVFGTATADSSGHFLLATHSKLDLSSSYASTVSGIDRVAPSTLSAADFSYSEANPSAENLAVVPQRLARKE